MIAVVILLQLFALATWAGLGHDAGTVGVPFSPDMGTSNSTRLRLLLGSRYSRNMHLVAPGVVCWQYYPPEAKHWRKPSGFGACYIEQLCRSPAGIFTFPSSEATGKLVVDVMGTRVTLRSRLESQDPYPTRDGLWVFTARFSPYNLFHYLQDFAVPLWDVAVTLGWYNFTTLHFDTSSLHLVNMEIAQY